MPLGRRITCRNADRDKAIKKLVANGTNIVETAKRFGISKQRVHQIVTGYRPPAHVDRRAYWRSYYARNRIVVLKRQGKLREKRRPSGITYKMLSVRFDVLARDKFTCRYCGRHAPDVELHVDHVVPKSKGGTDDPNNLVAACRDCNFGKRDVILNPED